MDVCSTIISNNFIRKEIDDKRVITDMISVLMSIYNEKEEWIYQSVESILNQTFADIEFIIVIDNPDIKETIKFYLKNLAIKDCRIKLLWNEKNIGLAQSLNRGIQIASGEYIARMDADDVSLPKRLELELQFIQKSGFDLISANKINIDENSDVISYDQHIKRDPNKVLQFSNIIVHPLVLVKTEVMRKMGGYRQLKNSEDLDLWLRMIDAGYKLGILDEYLLMYRIRSTSASVERRLEQYVIDKYIVKLMKERKRTGRDSFSYEAQTVYLKKNNITNKKKKKFEAANKEIELALSNMYEKKIIWVWDFFKGFLLCPSYALDKVRKFYWSMVRQ